MTRTQKYDPKLLTREYLDAHPEASNDDLYSLTHATTKGQKGYIRKRKSRLLSSPQKEESPESTSPQKSRSSLSQDDYSPTFIDDPNELLLSTAIRELNKSNPDPRWANILISCKKEKITTKGEVIDQFRQLTTQGLVNILSKSLQKES